MSDSTRVMTADEVERCLDVGREALVQFAELIVNGARHRGEIFARARVEADALIALLDEAPESSTERSTNCSTATRPSWRHW